MNAFVIFLSSFVLADLLIWVQGAWTLRRGGAFPLVRLAFHGFMAFQAVCLATMIIGRACGINIDNLLPTFVLIVVYLWHLLIAPVALAVNLLLIVCKGIRAVARYLLRPDPPELYLGGNRVTRREFLGTAVVLTPPLLSLAASAMAGEQLSSFRVRRLTVTLPQLPRALDGITIVHLTDTHVGRFTHGRVLQTIADETNALKPDLVVFTGDLINDSLDPLPEAIRMLQQIEQPVIACEGNHDLFVAPEEFRARLKAAPGVELLVNESKTLTIRGEPVQLLGLRWGGSPSGRRPRHSEPEMAASIGELLRQRDPAAFPILLAHHPHAWDYAGEIPLTFGGHTHGGQFMLNEKLGVGPAMYRYWSGLYTRTSAETGAPQALVISNGAGNWFPLRIHAPAEIIQVTLRSGAA